MGVNFTQILARSHFPATLPRDVPAGSELCVCVGGVSVCVCEQRSHRCGAIRKVAPSGLTDLRLNIGFSSAWRAEKDPAATLGVPFKSGKA